MIADPEGPSFITGTVGRRRYADNASVSHDPERTLATVYCSARESPASTGSPAETPTELGACGARSRGASVAVQSATDMVEPLSA
jgi:hypothetical protein